MIHISVSFRLENKVNKEAASPVVAPAVSVIYNRFEWSITERFMFCFFFVFLRASDYTHTHAVSWEFSPCFDHRDSQVFPFSFLFPANSIIFEDIAV